MVIVFPVTLDVCSVCEAFQISVLVGLVAFFPQPQCYNIGYSSDSSYKEFQCESYVWGSNPGLSECQTNV